MPRRKKKDEVVPAETLKEETARKRKPKMTKGEKIALEREIRRYVRADGGYRKDLPQKDKERCAKLLKKRPEQLSDPRHGNVVRDKSIIVPGLDKPTVAGIQVKK